MPLTIYDRVDELDLRLREARTRVDENLPPWKFPLAILNHAFQDGLADALNRMQAERRNGEDRRHHYLLHRASGYKEARRVATKARNYWDAAYIEGYEVGLVAIGGYDEISLRQVPVYYCPGIGPETSYKRVAAAIRSGTRAHNAAGSWASRQTKALPKECTLRIDHFFHDIYGTTQKAILGPCCKVVCKSCRGTVSPDGQATDNGTEAELCTASVSTGPRPIDLNESSDTRRARVRLGRTGVFLNTPVIRGGAPPYVPGVSP